MHAPRDPKKISVRRSDKRSSVRISILRGKKQHESPNNLTLYKWHHPLPTPEEEAALVLLARSGEPKAQRQLVANYQRLIHGIAGKRRLNHRFDKNRKVHTNEAFDELVARGFLALWQAVLTYDPTLGKPFSAYARLCISGQMSEESKVFIKQGLVGETRIDRWLYSHPKATPQELVAAFKRKGKEIDLWEAEYQIRAFKARHSFKKYHPNMSEVPKLKSRRLPTMAEQEQNNGE
jgi:hypothetical protein